MIITPRQCRIQNTHLAYKHFRARRYLWGWEKLLLCLSCCLLSHISGALAVASDTDHRLLLFKQGGRCVPPIVWWRPLLLTPSSSASPSKQTVNSFHIWQSWRTTYKWYASPAGPMATALTLLLRFFDPRQALIHFSFTLLAKHIMWIWSFVPDRPCLTSLSPQAPDASQRSCGGGEEFHGIQRLCWGCFWLLCLPFLCPPPALQCWPAPHNTTAKPFSWP